MTEKLAIHTIKQILLSSENPRGKEAEANLKWILQKYVDSQLILHGVVKSLKSNYTPEFEEWLLGFKKEDNLYLIDEDTKETKEEMYLIYREL